MTKEEFKNHANDEAKLLAVLKMKDFIADAKTLIGTYNDNQKPCDDFDTCAISILPRIAQGVVVSVCGFGEKHGINPYELQRRFLKMLLECNDLSEQMDKRYKENLKKASYAETTDASIQH